MRNYLFLALMLTCSALEAQDAKMNPEKRTVKWIQQADLRLAYSLPDSSSFAAERIAGKNWVFEYRYQAAENPEMTDDEMTEITGFEVTPTRSKRFILKDQQLEKAKAYYLLGCFCKDRGYKRIYKGTIRGTRINKKVWLVEANLSIETGSGTIQKKFRRRFTLSTQ